MKKILGIVVGGGPAPGINGVIRSVTLEAVNRGLDVIGFFDGFAHLIEGKSLHRQLHIADVSRIHLEGGSILRTSRLGPRADKKKLKNIVATLRRLKVDYLVTIGGDGTAFSSYQLSRVARKTAVVHVPKTIDNDIPLPDLMPTFGFHTARHVGTEIVSSLMTDAKATKHWYLVLTMGRKSGHLALGIGKAAGATLTLIPEEWDTAEVTLDQLAALIEGAIYKRLALGKPYGVAVLAEGLILKVKRDDLKKYSQVHFNPVGQVHLEEIDLGLILKEMIAKNLAKAGVSIKVLSKSVGYELRGLPPIPFDAEYTQDLGYAAVRHLLSGGSGDIVCLKRGGKLQTIPIQGLLTLDESTLRIREVDIHSDSYQVARAMMLRLEKGDFENKPLVQKMAKLAKMPRMQFLKKFSYFSPNP